MGLTISLSPGVLRGTSLPPGRLTFLLRRAPPSSKLPSRREFCYRFCPSLVAACRAFLSRCCEEWAEPPFLGLMLKSLSPVLAAKLGCGSTSRKHFRPKPGRIHWTREK
ncbi:hypothetical protein KIL84_008727 [Mauremys mutica]|uniref:Uncharacterized protein n=1 Tax=Mauremys mutica TaxID=74926 RepID=A0A9D4AZM5_9SAUR|nr:hypothetical protein KIL84_008727 [Mauremys mutica]